MQVTKSAIRTGGRSLELLVRALDGARAALPRRAAPHSPPSRNAATGIVVDAELRAQASEQRPHVGLERLEQDPVRAEHVALRAAPRRAAASSTSSAFAYAVWMFMTDWIIASILPSTLCDWSIMNATSPDVRARAISRMIRKSSNGSIEPTIRSSSAYLRLLKWKPPSSPSASSTRDDLLDVRALRVVAGVDEHLRLRPEPPAEQRRRAPVGQVGAVEGRLEELVLDEQPHARRQRRVELLEPVDEPRVAAAQVVLPGVVRAVGEPEADRRSSRPPARSRRTRGSGRAPARARARRGGRGCRGGRRRRRRGSG